MYGRVLICICMCVRMWGLSEDEGARVFLGRYIDFFFDLVYNQIIINH